MRAILAGAPRSLALLLALLVLVACGGASAPPAPTASPWPTRAAGQPAPVASPSPSPPIPTPAPRPFALWVAEEGAALDGVRMLAREFTASTGTPLEVLARPADGLRLSLATAALVGDPLPDLFWGDQELLAGLLADGQVQPPGVAAPDDTLPALLTAATADDRLWGVPLAGRHSLLLLYNRALTPEAPITSDALIARSRAAATKEVAGLVMAWDEARWLLPWLYAFGGAPLALDSQTISLDTPEMVAALGLLRELYVAAPGSGAGYQRGQRLFAQGYAAFAIDGDWALPRYRQVSDTLDLGIAPLPVVPATGRPAPGLLGGTYLLFQRDLSGKDLERARVFARWLLEPATQARIPATLARLPARTGALEAANVAADPLLAAMASGVAAAPGLPPTPAARCVLYAIDSWLPRLLDGASNQAETAAAMQAEAEQCLRLEPGKA
ncbi:MAG: sugar ABC transporter substrate-binding protein [Chloroflexaceae bacterium]